MINLDSLKSLAIPLSLNGGNAMSSSGGSSSVNPFEIPFNFDHSGFFANIKGQGNQSAQGNGGSKTGGAAVSPSLSSGGLGSGINLNLILIAAAAWLILRR